MTTSQSREYDGAPLARASREVPKCLVPFDAARHATLLDDVEPSIRVCCALCVFRSSTVASVLRFSIESGSIETDTTAHSIEKRNGCFEVCAQILLRGVSF